MEKKQIIDLSKKNNPPFYVYSIKKIKENCKFFLDIPYDNKLIAFATMSNNNKEFLKIIKEEGISVFVNSLKHLEKTIDIGFNPKDIVFTSSAMSEELMIEVHKKNCIVNLDSVNQIERWFKLFPKSSVGIRCNIGDIVTPEETRAGYFIGKNSRLGLTTQEILELNNKDKIKGIHLYLGTDIIEISYFKSCYNEFAKLVKQFPNLEYVDLGGGFGIEDKNRKKIDKIEYYTLINDLMLKINDHTGKKIKLILEPGRIIGGNSAYFITKVTDTKQREDHQYIGINSSTAQFPRPFIYPDSANHRILIHPKREKEYIKSSIYGCSTYSKDFFIKNKKLPKIYIDDLIIFCNAGSYCVSMFTEFLGFDKPLEIFV